MLYLYMPQRHTTKVKLHTHLTSAPDGEVSSKLNAPAAIPSVKNFPESNG
jgi:hypothetical protein